MATTSGQPPMKENQIFNNQWIVKKKVSQGSFGVVYIGMDKNTKEFVAIKLEKEDNEEVRSLEREVQILQKLEGVPNVPKLYWSGQENNYNIMVLNLLGRDLAYYMKGLKKFSLKTVLMQIDQLITVLENIHNRSIIHRDLKPENILMGREKETHMVYLIDYGISKIYRDQSGRHISFKEGKPFIGTTRYASIAAHSGHELGRKDDLESLAYVMIFLLKGSLPWQNLQNVSDKDKTQLVGDIKQKTKTTDLCKDLPIEFVKYLDYVKKLSFKQQPDYQYLKSMFYKLGQSMKVRYGENDWDWTDQTKLKNDEQQQQQPVQRTDNKRLTYNTAQKPIRSGDKKLTVQHGIIRNDNKKYTINKSTEQSDYQLRLPGQERNQNRQHSLTPSLTPSLRSACRKTTGGSFNGSVQIKYQASQMNKQLSSRQDFDDEEAENNNNELQGQQNFQDIDEYDEIGQALSKKLQILNQQQVKAIFKSKNHI